MPKIKETISNNDDDGKIKKTTYEKDGDGFLVGIDLRNSKELHEMGKLIEKREARNENRYIMGISYYWSKQKLIS